VAAAMGVPPAMARAGHKAAWARSRASPHEAGSRGDLGRDGERRGETGRDGPVRGVCDEIFDEYSRRGREGAGEVGGDVAPLPGWN
jgi:hypothetical protein